MKFVMKHFPFLFLFIFLFSCVDKEKENKFSNYYLKGFFFQENNVPDSAFFYFNKAKLSCKPEEANRMVFIILKTAQLQEKLGDVSGSVDVATESFKFFKNCDSISYIYAIYNCLGIDYEQQSKYDTSIDYYYKALKLASNPLDEIIIKNNIGVISLKEEKYEIAIKNFKKLLDEPILKLNKKYYAKTIDNLGYAYFKSGNKNLAYNYLIKSLEIRDSIGDDYEKTPSLMHLARFYQETDSNLTINYAKKAYESAKIVNNPDDKLEALDILIKNSLNIDDFKKYYQQFYSLKDSIDLIRKTAKNQFADMKYDSRLAVEKNEKLTAQNNLITFLFLGFGIIAILIYFLIRSQNKREKLKIA